jgi:dipeptide transport system permease protein
MSSRRRAGIQADPSARVQLPARGQPLTLWVPACGDDAPRQAGGLQLPVKPGVTNALLRPQSQMLRFILTRLSLVIPTFFGMTLLAFFLIRLVPGDPIETMAGERGIDAARHAKLLHRVRPRPPGAGAVRHLHRPGAARRPRQVHRHAGAGDPRVRALFPATIELARLRHPVRAAARIPAGIIAAVKRNSVFDHGVMATSLTGYSMPIFWWGLLLILLFSVQLGLDAGVGPHGREVLHRAQDTGFLLLDSPAVRRQGRLPVGGRT